MLATVLVIYIWVWAVSYLTGNGILRVPILYGEIQTLNESAVTVLFDKVKDASKEAKMCSKQKRYPTHCDDVAYVIRALAEHRLKVSLCRYFLV